MDWPRILPLRLLLQCLLQLWTFPCVTLAQQYPYPMATPPYNGGCDAGWKPDGVCNRWYKWGCVNPSNKCVGNVCCKIDMNTSGYGKCQGTCEMTNFCLDRNEMCFHGVCCQNPGTGTTFPGAGAGYPYGGYPNSGNMGTGGYPTYPAYPPPQPQPTVIVINGAGGTTGAGSSNNPNNPPIGNTYGYGNNYGSGYNNNYNNNNNGYNMGTRAACTMPDQAACQSMLSQCSNPSVAQTCVCTCQGAGGTYGGGAGNGNYGSGGFGNTGYGYGNGGYGNGLPSYGMG